MKYYIPTETQMMNEILFDPNETRIDAWNDYEEEYGVLPPFTSDFGNTIPAAVVIHPDQGI